MKLLETLRIVFISPEFLAILAIFATYYHVPALFESLGNQFKVNTEIWKFIPTIPLAICGFSIQYAWKILFPLDGAGNTILLQWPNYWKLKLRVITSVIICAVCFLGAISIWIYSNILSPNHIGAIFITISILSIISSNIRLENCMWNIYKY